MFRIPASFRRLIPLVAVLFHLGASSTLAEPCPNLLKSGPEFDALVLEAVTFLETPFAPGEGSRRLILNPTPLPEVSPRTPSGVPCLFTPNFIGAINREVDARHPPSENQVLGHTQLVNGLTTQAVFIVTHAIPKVEKLIEEFLEEKPVGPTLALASPVFSLPARLWNQASLVRYSSWGELPSGLSLNTSVFHLMGGSGIGCQMNTTLALLARLVEQKRSGQDTPRILVHTGLTYASKENYPGPLLRDFMRQVAGNSFKTYVQETYHPPSGFHLEIPERETSEGLGYFNFVHASGARVQVEYLYP